MTNQQLVQMATRHAVYLERLKTQEVRDFLPVIDKVQGAITEVLNGLHVDQINQLTQARLRKVLVQLEAAQTKLLGQATEAFLKRAERLADYEAEFQARSIVEVAPKGVQLRFPAKGSAMERALKKPMAVNGDLMNSFMGDWQQSEVKQVSGLVRKAWAQGNTVDELTRAIRGTKANNFKDGAVAISRRHAESVARTTLAHVANVAREETWTSNEDIVTGYKWVSTLDSRTSPQCRALDGQVFKIGEGPTPPVHVGCRSTTVAELDSKYDWLDEGATRSTENGPVKADQTYYEWLKDQPAEFQDSVLGPARGKLFRSDGMTAEKFQSLSLNKNFEPLTLEQMRAEEAKGLKVSMPEPTNVPTVTVPKVDIEPKVIVKYLADDELGVSEFDVRRYRAAVKSGDKAEMKHFASRLKDDGLKVMPDGRVVQTGPRLWDSVPQVGADVPAVPTFAKRQENWINSLSKEQKEAARWWSDSVQNVAKVREAEAGSGATPEAKAFLDAIKDAPAYEGTVFRGQQMDNWRSLKVGKTFSFKTIVSSSKSLDVGAEFSSYAYQHPVLFRIHTKNGTDISRLVAPEYLEQQEVLLRASAKFRVTRVATSSTEYGDFPLISLEEM